VFAIRAAASGARPAADAADHQRTEVTPLILAGAILVLGGLRCSSVLRGSSVSPLAETSCSTRRCCGQAQLRAGPSLLDSSSS
jgi:hypothetical protein